MLKRRIALAIGLAMVGGGAWAAEPVTDLPVIQAQGTQTSGALTTLSIDQAQQELDAIPGGTTLVPETQIREGMTRSLQEALAFTPGVYSRSRFGSDEVRLSIRGSGITQTFNMRGVRLLRDGLPMTEADGNVRPQLIEPLNAHYMSVYRGANALEFGAATLGGAINLVSPTARTYEDYPLRLEGGSDEYLRFQAANGRVFNNDMDVYGSLTGISQDGFRENSKQETTRFYGNTGKRWNDNTETRFHLDLQDNNLELPGSLTMAQLKDDPTQANAGSLKRNSQRDFTLYRGAAQHTLLLADGGRADFGVSYQYLDMFHPLSFALLESDQNDVSLSSRVTRYMDWGSREHTLVFGGLATWGDSDGARYSYVGGFSPAAGGQKGAKIRDDESEAYNLELFAQDTIPLSERTDVIVGAQAVFAKRDSSETPVATGIETSRDEDYTGFSPRLGMTLQATDNIQLFSNISRSYEPPTNSEFAEPLDDGSEEILDAQKATTVEIGSRGRLMTGLNYEIALYYAWVKDEILFQEDPSLPVGSGETVTANADDTVHSGVELGIHGDLTSYLRLAAAYTYNNFEFDGDDTYDDNEIPGIPRHFLNAEVLYRHSSGFYIGPTVEYASDWYVDFSNSLEADSYTVWGARAGYQVSKHLRLFAEAVNLTDKEYASNTSIIADANGQDASVFNPGLLRSFFAGVELRI